MQDSGGSDWDAEALGGKNRRQWVVGSAPQHPSGHKAPGLLESILLLGLIVAGAIVGLALQQNWPKILRVASASAGYFTVLIATMRSQLARAKWPGVLPYWPSCLAGAAAGLLSALVRASTSPALIVTHVLGAALLLGGAHWAALLWWVRTRSRLEI